MNKLLTFLWVSSLILSVFYSIYYLLLRRERAFLFNRFYLLTGSVLTLLLPLGVISGSNMFVGGETPVTRISQQIISLPAVSLQANAEGAPSQGHDWTMLLAIIYLAGLSVAWMRLHVQLIKLRRQFLELDFRPTGDGFFLAEVSGTQPSFSFFNHLIINPADAANAAEYELIIRHEKAHALQKHSLDVLLVELLAVMLWFLPWVYRFRNSLQQIHEYLADEQVLGRKLPETTYIQLMARISLRAAGLPVTSPFNQFSTLNRIKMIQKQSKPSYVRLATGLLLAGVLSLMVACQQESDRIIDQELPHEVRHERAKENEEVFERVDHQPEPIGGMEAYYQGIAEKLKYPELALVNNVEGRVFIQFVIQSDGTLSQAEVIRSAIAFALEQPTEEEEAAYRALDAEALRVLEELPIKWEPGQVDEKAVAVKMILPISFRR